EKVSLVLWDVKSGEIIQEMVLWPKVRMFWRNSLSKCQLGPFTISNDLRLVAFAKARDKTIEIWETASGTKRGELSGHVGQVVDLAFSADDRQLASGSEDTTVLVWDMNRPLRPAKFKQRLSEEELKVLWETLFQSDAKNADVAIWSLVNAAK